MEKEKQSGVNVKYDDSNSLLLMRQTSSRRHRRIRSQNRSRKTRRCQNPNRIRLPTLLLQANVHLIRSTNRRNKTLPKILKTIFGFFNFRKYYYFSKACTNFWRFCLCAGVSVSESFVSVICISP